MPCAPIADYGQVFTDDHLNQRGYFWDAPHPHARAGPPARVADAPVPDAHRARTPPARSWARAPAPPSSGRRSRLAEIDALIESGVAADPAHTVAAEPPAVPPQPADDRPL